MMALLLLMALLLSGNIPTLGAIYYKYSTLPRGISINIVSKVGIFPEAEVNIHYQWCNIIDIPQGRVEYLFYYIG